MDRKKATIKNYIWSNISTVFTLLLGFANRTVLIKTVGTTYLGINGLFSNVLGVLSFAELGIGLAISYCLYKPLAENDIEKIKAIIGFYKNAYRIVGTIIIVFGTVLIPFLPKIAKGTDNVDHLVLIFCIYVFNSASSYFLTYKTTLVSADQKNYLITNIYTVFNIVTTSVQIVVLLLFKNFIIYILVLSLISLIRNVYLNYFTTKKYPFLKGKNNAKLDKNDKKDIFVSIKGLVYHQIGGVVIGQTDNIIISSFINVDTVGIVSNYTMIINIIKSFVTTVFSALLPSYGNVIATEKSEYQYIVFKRLNFLAYMITSFTTICLFFLSEPFINVWIGNNYVIDSSTVFVLVLNYYIMMTRQPLDVLSKAAGIFDQTKISPIIESIVNLVASITLVKFFGLIGVFIGTFISSFIPNIWISIVSCKIVFKKSSKDYLVNYYSRLLLTFLYIIILDFIFKKIDIGNNYLLFLVRFFICTLVSNGLNLMIYFKSDELKYFISIIGTTIKRITKNLSH